MKEKNSRIYLDLSKQDQREEATNDLPDKIIKILISFEKEYVEWAAAFVHESANIPAISLVAV